MYGAFTFGSLVFGGAYAPTISPAPGPTPPPLPADTAVTARLSQRGQMVYGLPIARVVEIEYATIADTVIPRRNQPAKFVFALSTPRIVEIEYVLQVTRGPITDPSLRVTSDSQYRITFTGELRRIRL